jgi:regulator of protease activity HflC (stomatin/prohibitin superfamily)
VTVESIQPDIQHQVIVAKDNVGICLDCALGMHPAPDEESIKCTFYSLDDARHAITQLAMTNLRQKYGDLNPDESPVSRERIAANLQRV